MTDLGQATNDRSVRPRSGPLAHIRVADFCWVGVGSVATRLLADFGAQVIKIESRRNLDQARKLPIYKNEDRTYGDQVTELDPNKGGLFNNYCRNKLGITVDMATDDGRSLVERLISKCSVVTENFTPGVMERWGLTYERLQELSPDVIFARMSGFGHDGPHRDFRSYGPVVQAVSGLSFISGLPDREPSGWGLSYMDNQAAYYNSLALLMAIYRRAVTGKGTEIGVSAVEVGVNLIGPLLLDVSVNARPTRRPGFPTGNRLEWPSAAPHGVYPARGEDRWIAISVFSDVQWRGLVEVLGRPAWALDSELGTQEGRFRHQDEIDSYLSAWTADQDRMELTGRLQAAGVPAGSVQDPRDVAEYDPQLASRAVFFEMDHPVIGPARFEAAPIKFSELNSDRWRSAPLLGEDNAYVFKQIVGLTDAEFDSYETRGIL